MRGENTSIKQREKCIETYQFLYISQRIYKYNLNVELLLKRNNEKKRRITAEAAATTNHSVFKKPFVTCSCSVIAIFYYLTKISSFHLGNTLHRDAWKWVERKNCLATKNFPSHTHDVNAFTPHIMKMNWKTKTK